ncbi:rhodanese-like domain-containing protein [Actinotalea sp. K2]|uniref:rhodanese-like domain-containing protein n=1 Tax=Actinotalea sp. K2 TaxID=2939438 RepID=UPI002017BBB4|nr:rhodanese-like domain-containing protein [Actinotalea sp. K2]MCL3860790.1 rhodanese-like domain-containing protein [Actinotalea sp. K2]
MTEVSIDQLRAARADGAVVVDVREPGEYVQGHVPGARLIPLSQIPASAHELPSVEPVYVICASGNRSLRASELLGRAGINARSVRGGTRGWVDAGQPVVTGPRADQS